MWLPEYSQTVLNIKVLTSGYLSNITPEEKINLDNTWPHSFGLAPCPYNSISFLQLWNYTYHCYNHYYCHPRTIHIHRNELSSLSPSI